MAKTPFGANKAPPFGKKAGAKGNPFAKDPAKAGDKAAKKGSGRPNPFAAKKAR